MRKKRWRNSAFGGLSSARTDDESTTALRANCVDLCLFCFSRDVLLWNIRTFELQWFTAELRLVGNIPLYSNIRTLRWFVYFMDTIRVGAIRILYFSNTICIFDCFNTIRIFESSFTWSFEYLTIWLFEYLTIRILGKSNTWLFEYLVIWILDHLTIQILDHSIILDKSNSQLFEYLAIQIFNSLNTWSFRYLTNRILDHLNIRTSLEYLITQKCSLRVKCNLVFNIE